MKTMKEIKTGNIICNVMTAAQFIYLQNAEYDRWDLDCKTARKGLRRLTRGLAKFGLTVADWDAWNRCVWHVN